jgi:WhiB family redox-sensing transcriptional regulator
MNAVNPDDFFQEIAAGLDEFEHVPDDVLWEIVTRDGSCMWLYQLDLEPEWTGNARTDRELAAQVCAECSVRRECLELELRTSGDRPLGVWGALPAEDVREVYRVWSDRRQRRAGQDGGRP